MSFLKTQVPNRNQIQISMTKGISFKNLETKQKLSSNLPYKEEHIISQNQKVINLRALRETLDGYARKT